METLTLQPDATAGIDTMISSLQAASNYATDATLHIGNAKIAGDDFRRALLRFDLTSLETGSEVRNATLTLTGSYSFLTQTSKTFSAYRLAQTAWTEAGATWNTYDGSTSWSTAGGEAGVDYVTTDGDSTTDDGTGTSLVFDGLGDLAQDAFDNRSGLLNLILIGPEPAGSRFYAEMASSDDATPANRPQLVVNYDFSVHYLCAYTVQTLIKAMDIRGIDDANVLLRKVPKHRDGDGIPGIIVSTWQPEGMNPRAGTNERDDVGYPVTVSIHQAGNQDMETNQSRIMAWRRRIIKYFRQQRLSGVDEIYTCTVEPAMVFDRAAIAKNVDQSSFVLRFFSREDRGN